jgi:hypothetical protein
LPNFIAKCLASLILGVTYQHVMHYFDIQDGGMARLPPGVDQPAPGAAAPRRWARENEPAGSGAEDPAGGRLPVFS